MKTFIFILSFLIATACTKGTGVSPETIVGKWKLVKLETTSDNRYAQEITQINQKLYANEVFEFTADGLLIYSERSVHYKITAEHHLIIEEGFLMTHNEKMSAHIQDKTLTIIEINEEGDEFVETFIKY